MKHLKYLILPLFVLSILCACSDDEEAIQPIIKGDTKAETVGDEAATTQLPVTATDGYDNTIEQ